MKLKKALIGENYYTGQLEKLEPSDDELISVQFIQGSNKTKFMNLNSESIPQLIKFLKYVNGKFKNASSGYGPPNSGY